jgi:acetyl esterase/lipase
MKRADYPPQEPLTEAGEVYSSECWKRSEGIAFDELSYGSDPYQRVAVYKPAKPNGTILLFWHGGGWTSGYKEWFGFMAPAFNAAGITFVSAGYRLAPANVFPVGLEDCIRGIEYVKKNLNPSRLYIGGHSAGGHYAALIAARGRKDLAGCLPISGVYEFGEGSGMSMRPRFIGAATEHEVSPRHQLASSMAPFLVAWGTKDFPHLIPQAERFVAAVKDAGGKAQGLPMEGLTHFTASYAGGEAGGPWVPAALRFMGAG